VSDPVVLFEIQDEVAHLTLNRPDAANALDLPTAHGLISALDRADREGALAVLLTGAGPRFCAGGDVTTFLAAEEPAAYVAELAQTAGAAVRRLVDLPIPVIAAVSGAVAGAGLGLVCAADIVVADPSTRFALAYAEIGLTPDCEVSRLLPQVIGLRQALALALTRQVLTAETAAALTLVTELHPDPVARAAELARTIAGGPAAALGLTRQLMRAGLEADRDAHARREVETISAAVGTPEARELISAFLARSGRR
jgi:2-(1,2-epoxy-1,2-dihydrophenyl)acetyl-CoA isomerase